MGTNQTYKKIEFVNFNCTFGENNEPMLNHFIDILYPAMTADYRFTKKKLNQWRLHNVHIDKLNDDYVLIGNFINDTVVEIKSHSSQDDIVPADERYPSSPYSIFILSLKNHRMAFYRNQSESPQVRSMKTIVNDCVKHYLRSVNKERPLNKLLPRANINIAPIPSAFTIDEKFQSIKKISKLSFKLFPLNGDPDISGAFNFLRNFTQAVGSKSSNIMWPSPSNINEVKASLKGLNGLATPKIHAWDHEGNPVIFNEDSFTESIYAQVNPSCTHDEISAILCSSIKSHPIMNTTSEINNTIYKNSLNDIKSILGGDKNDKK